MQATDVADIGREALFVLLQISLPLMMVALAVGLIVALFQALTQIQEMTLTFVPKIVAIFLALLFMGSFMFTTLKDFSDSLVSRIVQID